MNRQEITFIVIILLFVLLAIGVGLFGKTGTTASSNKVDLLSIVNNPKNHLQTRPTFDN